MIELYGGLLDSDSLSLAAHRLAAKLAAVCAYDRVSIGLGENDGIRLIASSHLDPAQLRSELGQWLTGAMQEALEQGRSLAYPALAGEDMDILVEHRLLQQQVGGSVASVPLGAGGDCFAAVCVEQRNGAAFTAAELLRLERLLLLAAPALRWMHAATEPWHHRAWRELLRHWVALRRPERRGRRRILASVTLATAFVALAPLADDVGGRARIEGAEQRVIAAPTDGFVKTAHVRPGDRVKSGEPLVDLLEADLRLERERWSSQLAQHENAYAGAMARSDRLGAATSMARIGEAQAQLALVDEQLARGRISAPFDALVIQGDLSQAIGAPVRQGDTLLTLATTGRYRIVIDVDEVDIARVQPGQVGQLALSALPWADEDIVVERIAPLAKAVDGHNVFEVEARLVSPRADLRPGLLGRAELVTGHAPLLWAWTRQTLLRLRVAAWAWLG